MRRDRTDTGWRGLVEWYVDQAVAVGPARPSADQARHRGLGRHFSTTSLPRHQLALSDTSCSLQRCVPSRSDNICSNDGSGESNWTP